MRYLKFILPILFLIFISNCDFEKLSSYQYTSDQIPESVKIYGKVSNRFTFAPVKDAEVSVQNQATVSDENGNYLLFYHFTENEDRNQPVVIKIAKDNYLSIDSSIVVFPENEINAFLYYGSPEIQNICLIDSLGICQAIIHDYQGYKDIVFVEVNLAYRIPGMKYPALYTKMRMNRVMTDSIKTNYYQVKAPVSMTEYGNLMDVYDIYAEDKLKHSDSMSSNEIGASTSLLFPIITK